MGGDPKGGDRDNASDYRMNLTYEPDRARGAQYTVNGQTRTPVLNERGEQVGYMSDALPTGIFGALAASLGGKVYTGDQRYNPTGVSRSSGDGENNPMRSDPQAAQRAALANSRQGRANALAAKQAELASAFSAFDDDFYSDLDAGYTEFQNPLLAQGYDDSLRGIYEGFKARGVLTQSELDAAISGLDTARAAEQARIAQGAADYSNARRTEIAKKQQQLGDRLSSLVGGATTADAVDAQTRAINELDFSKDVEKLRTPGAKGNLNFFQNFDKVSASAAPSTNVQAVSASGAPQIRSITPAVFRTGIQSPYQGGSLKVIS